MPHNLAVFSHHRSGTHFLMKALALNSKYLDDPAFPLDVNLAIDLWNPHEMRRFLERLEGERILSIARSHFEAAFFADVMDELLTQFQLIYIVRRPEDALKSYFDLTHRLNWLEAPDCRSADEFVKAPPEGSALRWQYRQYETMAHRWVAHVEGWLDLAEKHSSLIVITYEELNDQYQASMKRLIKLLEWPEKLVYDRPEMTGIMPGQGGSHSESYHPDSLAWLSELTEATYRRGLRLSQRDR